MTDLKTNAEVKKNYLNHLIEQIEVDENRITVVPKAAFRSMA